MTSKCADRRKRRGKTYQQKMIHLPEGWLIEEPPFSYCDVERRKKVEIYDKRHGALFTLLCSRAVHIEATNNMTTDSFVGTLRRHTSRRENIGIIQSGNSSNLVRASI